MTFDMNKKTSLISYHLIVSSLPPSDALLELLHRHVGPVVINVNGGNMLIMY